MKRGDYVRLPDGSVGVYSANIGYSMCFVVMPDWSVGCFDKDKLELIGAKDESNRFNQDVPVKLPEGAALGNGAKDEKLKSFGVEKSGNILTGLHIQDPKPASSGVWIFTDKWYKTQSQWEGGYFVEGKWVSPKELKGSLRDEDWKFQLKRGDRVRIKLNGKEFIVVSGPNPNYTMNTTNPFHSWIVQPHEIESKVEWSMKDVDWDKATSSLTGCEHTEPLNSWQIEEKETGKKWDHNKSTYVCGADVKGRENIPVPEEASKEEVDEFTKKFERFMDENKPIAPPKVGDWVRYEGEEGRVIDVNDETVWFMNKNGYVFAESISDVDIITFNPGDRVANGEGVSMYEKTAKEWKTALSKIRSELREEDMSVVMEMIGYESSLWIDAPQEMTGSERKIHVAKKLLEKYTIHRK